MDQSELVSQGHALLDLLDKTDLKPRVAIWVYSSDTDDWRFWIVPSKGMTDKREFYRRVAECINADVGRAAGIDIGSIEMMLDTHPAITALATMFKIEGRSSARLSRNMLNGFYLPDGVALRIAL